MQESAGRRRADLRGDPHPRIHHQHPVPDAYPDTDVCSPRFATALAYGAMGNVPSADLRPEHPELRAIVSTQHPVPKRLDNEDTYLDTSDVCSPHSATATAHTKGPPRSRPAARSLLPE